MPINQISVKCLTCGVVTHYPPQHQNCRCSIDCSNWKINCGTEPEPLQECQFWMAPNYCHAPNQPIAGRGVCPHNIRLEKRDCTLFAPLEETPKPLPRKCKWWGSLTYCNAPNQSGMSQDLCPHSQKSEYTCGLFRVMEETPTTGNRFVPGDKVYIYTIDTRYHARILDLVNLELVVTNVRESLPLTGVVGVYHGPTHSFALVPSKILKLIKKVSQ